MEIIITAKQTGNARPNETLYERLNRRYWMKREPILKALGELRTKDRRELALKRQAEFKAYMELP